MPSCRPDSSAPTLTFAHLRPPDLPTLVEQDERSSEGAVPEQTKRHGGKRRKGRTAKGGRGGAKRGGTVQNVLNNITLADLSQRQSHFDSQGVYQI